MPRRYSKADLATLRTDGLCAQLPAPKKRKNDEFVLQCALISWWADYCKTVGVPEFLLWHTPNSAVYGGSKEQREKMGAMLKRLGQRSGVPDLFLAVAKYAKESPTVRVRFEGFVGTHDSYAQFAGLFLELKSPKGVISPEQTVMLQKLQKQGYFTAVCRTLEDAQKVITEYLTR